MSFYNARIAAEARKANNDACRERKQRVFVREADFSGFDCPKPKYYEPQTERTIYDWREGGLVDVADIKPLLDCYSRVHIEEGVRYVDIYVSNDCEGFTYTNSTTYKPAQEFLELFAGVRVVRL